MKNGFTHYKTDFVRPGHIRGQLYEKESCSFYINCQSGGFPQFFYTFLLPQTIVAIETKFQSGTKFTSHAMGFLICAIEISCKTPFAEPVYQHAGII